MVRALDFQAGYRGFESRSGRANFQTILTPSSYSTCPGLSIKWTGRRLVTDSGTKCAWVIHESKAVQIQLHHSNRRCLYVPWVPGSVKKIRTTTIASTYAPERRKKYIQTNLPKEDSNQPAHTRRSLVRVIVVRKFEFLVIQKWCAVWSESSL